MEMGLALLNFREGGDYSLVLYSCSCSHCLHFNSSFSTIVGKIGVGVLRSSILIFGLCGFWYL